MSLDFEMAHSDDPKEIVMATQRSLTKAMRELIGQIRKELKSPGLSWEQLDYLIDQFEKKEPTIITQASEM